MYISKLIKRDFCLSSKLHFSYKTIAINMANVNVNETHKFGLNICC